METIRWVETEVCITGYCEPYVLGAARTGNEGYLFVWSCSIWKRSEANPRVLGLPVWSGWATDTESVRATLEDRLVSILGKN